MPLPAKIIPYIEKNKSKRRYSRILSVSILFAVVASLVILVNRTYYWVAIEQNPFRLTIPLHPVIKGKENLKIELTKAGIEYIPKEKKLSVYIENFTME